MDVIVDVGPQPTIWSNMQAPEFAGKSRLAFTGKRGKDQIVAMLAALSVLFEKGFSVDFQSLYGQMPYKFAMTDIPTYPFQRIHNYPAYIASRNTLLGLGTVSVAKKSKQPKFVVDQALCDFLDLHRIEGRRVLPGAAMVDFFARAADNKAVKNIRFHVPLVLETPETQVRAIVDGNGDYQLSLDDEAGTKICSGVLGDNSTSYIPKRIEQEPEFVPLHMMSKVQIYECFKNVQFGDPFRTVQEVKIWETHADGDIKLEATGDPAHDRIRKLDACLHMFGAISSKLAPAMDDTAGAYLPTSLEDFKLHTEEIPYNFTCRYRLPLEIGKGARMLSASFEVLSETGELLVSCRKYSVAWVPRGVVHKEQKAEGAKLGSWLRNGWSTQPLPARLDISSAHKYDELLYLGNGASSRILTALSAAAKDIVSIELSGLSQDSGKNDKVKSSTGVDMESVPSKLRGKDLLIVLDLTKANNTPGSDDFAALYNQILTFMKAMASRKLHISSVLAISSWSAPVDLYKENLDLFSDSKASSTSLVGAILQGMMRVFRREISLDFAAWCLDLPSLDTLDQDKLNSIISREIEARHQAVFNDTFVSYREDASKNLLSRLVPILEPIEQVQSRSPSGTTVIVGMGSIGSSLAMALVESGVGQVVFFGRRPETNDDVSIALPLSLPCR